MLSASWKSWPNLFCIHLLLCATGVVSEKFQLAPLNLTVLQGSNAQFNATVQREMQVMTWTVQGTLVLTVANGIISSSSEQFSARICSSGNISCVEFTIHNVTRRESGTVICTVQGEYGSKTAHLYVQESGSVNIMGGNMTVVQDQQVEFQCVTSAWFPIPTVSWTQNGEAVDSNLYNTTSMADGNSTSVLKFVAVRTSTVECLATVSTLPEPQSSSVFLVVVPKPPDWTVLIAVVVSIGGFALLVLLILGIIFCYKHRKEKQPNYQDEMSRRVRTQSQRSGVNAAGQRQGQENAGYVPEGQTGVAPSELTDSGFGQENGSSVFKMHGVVTSNQAGNDYSGADNTVDKSGFKKHRHVTIV